MILFFSIRLLIKLSFFFASLINNFFLGLELRYLLDWSFI
nr:MAG TPA: hypothetical protein [Caudoviricetes sp.]